MRGPRFNISISKECYDDIHKRKKDKKFNVSNFVETKYREEFLNEAGIKDKLRELKKEIVLYEDRLASIKGGFVQKQKYDTRRCPFCEMFFQEDIAIRKKIHVYKGLYACAQCNSEQQHAIKKQIEEMKSMEE